MDVPRSSRWIVFAATASCAASFSWSCGRIGFGDISGDGNSHGSSDSDITGSGDAPVAGARLVAMSGSSTGDTQPFSTWQVTIPSVSAGDLVVVAVADHNGDQVVNVVDGAGTQLASATRAVMGTISSELWYESNAKPTTSLTLTMSAMTHFDVWVAEFSHINPGPADVVANGCLQYPPSVATAPVTTTVANELVVSVTMAAYPLYLSTAQPPFSGLQPINGNAAGYYVAPQPGSYASSFDIAMGTGMTAVTCESTAAWLP
jgi:hypothetical protein